MRIPFSLALLLLLAVAGTSLYMYFDAYQSLQYQYASLIKATNEQQREQLQSLKKEPNTSTQSHSLLFVGDIMLDRGVEERILNVGNGKYTFPFTHVRSILKQGDITFGNLEGSLSNVGSDQGSKYSFHFPKRAVHALRWAGFDVLSLANNHITDWGMKSLCATPDNLQVVNIASVGAGCNKDQAESPYITKISEDTTVGFLAYTKFLQYAEATKDTPGVSKWSEKHIKQRIKNLQNNKVDIIIVSLHWGTEYEKRSQASQQELAHSLIDTGADVIVGHHPHVTQEIERYKDGWIIYSLGNFVFDQDFSKGTMRSMIAKAKVKNEEVITVNSIPVRLNENYQPQLQVDEEKIMSNPN